VKNKFVWFGGVFSLGLLADQSSKAWVVNNLEFGIDEVQIIDGWVSFVHAHNTGAAFSMLEGGYWLFLAFTGIATLVVVDMIRRLPSDSAFLGGVLGMLLSGAYGNAIDRVRLGWVTDFVKCYTEHPALEPWLIDTFGTSVYPIWNVADASLLVGVAIYLLHGLIVGDPVTDGSDDPAVDNQGSDAPAAS
jgi:signal peptidase II